MRKCGACTLCCTLPAIPELDKPAGVPCRHLTAKGCGIYDSPERPELCRSFACNWLKGAVDEHARPDIVGAFTTPMADGDGLGGRGGMMVHAEDRRFERFGAMRRIMREVVDAGGEVLIATVTGRRIITNNPAVHEIARERGVRDQDGQPVSVEVW